VLNDSLVLHEVFSDLLRRSADYLDKACLRRRIGRHTGAEPWVKGRQNACHARSCI